MRIGHAPSWPVNAVQTIGFASALSQLFILPHRAFFSALGSVFLPLVFALPLASAGGVLACSTK
jgi:hypothetical protein